MSGDDEIWFDEDLPPAVALLHERYREKAQFFAAGRNRNVFLLNSRWVVKLPRTTDGFADNFWEGSQQANPESDPEREVQLPQTRLLYVQNVPVLFMERIEPEKDPYGKHMPDWVDWVDCAQVGYTRDKRLVAYDYGMR